MTSWKLSVSFPQLLWKITLTKEDKNTEHISPERKEQQIKKKKNTTFKRAPHSSNETNLSWKVFCCFLGQGCPQIKWEVVQSIGWMTKLHLGKKAALKSSLANYRGHSKQSLFLTTFKNMLTALFSSPEWQLQEECIRLTSDVLTSLPTEYMS